MPDLDFSGLRNKLRSAVEQPPVDDVITRAHRRTNRRRLQIVSAAAVVLVVAAVPLLRLGVQRDTAAPASPSDQNFVVAIDFYDQTHGYALGGSCEHRPICDAWVMATGNAETWEKRSTPPLETGFSGQPDRLVTLGTTTVVIDDHRPGGIVKRFFSSDGARSWHEVPIPPAGAPYSTIPPSGILECRDGVVTVLLNGNGYSARLAEQPPIEVTSCQPYPDTQGKWWVAGLDRTTREPVVARSISGLGWQVSALPPTTRPAGDTPLEISVVTSPTAVYATVTTPADTPADLVAIFRSTDAGATWQQTWQASADKQPTSISGVPVAGVDGKLRISQYPRVADEVWTSADGGTTFRAEPTLNAADVRLIRTGYLASRSDSASTGEYLTSYDGIQWWTHRVPFP